jgi:lipopolysaccharide export LptBFGC system permease protein LptF
MTHRFLTLCASLIALCTAGNTVTQANTDSPAQAANPQENSQKIEIGGDQSGNVKVGNIVQNQSGKGGNQNISIGNAKGKGGSTNVTVGNIVQNQKEGDGSSGNQTIELGPGTHGDIIQNGGGTRKVETGAP